MIAICNEGKSDDQIMLVAFEKESNDPPGLILLKQPSYEASKLTSVPGHAVASDMRTTIWKLMWEVTYCVRRVDKRSSCLGDILLSCAIQEVRERAQYDSYGASTYMWLVLAGGFSNVPALRLYLAYGFEIIGFYEVESEILMAIRNVGERKLKLMNGKQAEIIEAYNGQAERRRREQLGGFGGPPPPPPREILKI